MRKFTRLTQSLTLVAAWAFSNIVWSETDVATPDAPTPVASKPYPNAASSLMLDIENTGNGFVAVGARGHILRSDDGHHWEQMSAPANALLTSVSFADENNGWAVGHDSVILNTTDGGRKWTVQHFNPGGTGPLLDVHFDNSKHGFAIGSFGSFLETTDGGKTWNTPDAPAVIDPALHLYSISRITSGRLLIVGEMGFIAVSDDGNLWTQLDSPYDGSFYAAAPYGTHGALLVGMRGNAFSIDNLDTGEWRQYETGTVLSLTAAIPVNPQSYLVTTLNRGLLRLDVSGQASRLPVATNESDAKTGSFNDVLPVSGELMIASDTGILRLDVPEANLSARIRNH